MDRKHEGYVAVGEDLSLEVRCTCGWRHAFGRDDARLIEAFSQFQRHGMALMGRVDVPSNMYVFVTDDDEEPPDRPSRTWPPRGQYDGPRSN